MTVFSHFEPCMAAIMEGLRDGIYLDDIPVEGRTFLKIKNIKRYVI